ncbi:MAG: hypothetical protein AB7J13_07460 [Pyrinomonadaceae bacterium]
MSYLAESLMMRSRIYLHRDNFNDAVMALTEAIDIARVHTGEEQANAFAEEFRATIENCRQSRSTETTTQRGELELAFPPGMSLPPRPRGVWINNPNLESAGIPEGALAVVADEKVKRGDLVAITENATGEVICGFYDNEFGIICLDTPGFDPLLFDENDVSVVGPIVGVCRTGANADGKMTVEPLKL